MYLHEDTQSEVSEVGLLLSWPGQMQSVTAWLVRKDLISLVFSASASRKGTLSWGPSLGDLLQHKTRKPHRKHFIWDLL